MIKVFFNPEVVMLPNSELLEVRFDSRSADAREDGRDEPEHVPTVRLPDDPNGDPPNDWDVETQVTPSEDRCDPSGTQIIGW